MMSQKWMKNICIQVDTNTNYRDFACTSKCSEGL